MKNKLVNTSELSIPAESPGKKKLGRRVSGRKGQEKQNKAAKQSVEKEERNAKKAEQRQPQKRKTARSSSAPKEKMASVTAIDRSARISITAKERGGRNKGKGNGRKEKKAKKTAGIKIIPLGGIGEVGKNMKVIEWEDNILVVDCGLVFPRQDMLGIDYVIPDITYLEKNKSKIKGFVLTHGHEDHIGATPYVLDKFDVPVYGTRLTLALVELKLSEHGVKHRHLKCVEAGDKVNCGVFEIEFIKVSHSIDDAVGLAIKTPVGMIVHTGDFKVDYTPIDGKITDLHKFAQLGSAGVLALLSDSTNAERPGYTISEKTVGQTFERYFSEAKGRIIIATFASNIHRLQQVVDAAKKFNRKICLTGRSMVRIHKVATELGYLNIPEKMLIDIDDIHSVRDNKIVVLTTGSQGEPMSGLVRMASGEHSKLEIKRGDTVIISSTPIPGNEKYVSDVINLLYRKGANVVYSSIAQVHVSGHACQEELKLMLSLVRPQYFIPVHGEYRQIYSHASLAESMGIPNKNIFISEIGKPIELHPDAVKLGESVPSGIVMIDGLGIGDVGSVVLRDRKLLSMDGLFVSIVAISRQTGELVAGPEILSRGFVYLKEAENLLEDAKSIVRKTVEECLLENLQSDEALIKNRVRKELNTYLYTRTKRSPMILPVIIEV